VRASQRHTLSRVDAPREDLPRFVEPMLATSGTASGDPAAWAASRGWQRIKQPDRDLVATGGAAT
jgi:hypothetical protein